VSTVLYYSWIVPSTDAVRHAARCFDTALTKRRAHACSYLVALTVCFLACAAHAARSTSNRPPEASSQKSTLREDFAVSRFQLHVRPLISHAVLHSFGTKYASKMALAAFVRSVRVQVRKAMIDACDEALSLRSLALLLHP
jgi:hypothetical protein